MATESAEERRARRAGWPVRRARLDDAAGDDLSGSTTPAERVAMMWELQVQAWLVAGRELPTYDRAHCPTRLIRPGELVPDDDHD
jgi:hypothetical protein